LVTSGHPFGDNDAFKRKLLSSTTLATRGNTGLFHVEGQSDKSRSLNARAKDEEDTSEEELST
jgi:hypothetical protein